MKRKSITGNKKAGLMGWLLNGPYLIYSLIFFLIPLIWAFWLSTMDWNLMSEQKTFVGIRNFAGLFSDSRVKAAFINSYRYLLPIVVPVSYTHLDVYKRQPLTRRLPHLHRERNGWTI